MSLVTGIRGINNRNPLNIKAVGDPALPSSWWDGSLGRDELGHAIFTNEIYSVRAGCRILAQYQLKQKKFSLADIFRTWAPSDDPNANNQPDDYAVFVGAAMKVSATVPVQLFFSDGHIRDSDQLFLMLEAMMEMECFYGYELPAEMIRTGLQLYDRDFAH